mmetsp:Transcript_6146/g.17443  ORF Transcript_6146/g.17443 Transcript_6146/m.17443 type:complete len:362 (-) Transcript_6146:170-1255(-)
MPVLVLVIVVHNGPLRQNMSVPPQEIVQVPFHAPLGGLSDRTISADRVGNVHPVSQTMGANGIDQSQVLLDRPNRFGLVRHGHFHAARRSGSGSRRWNRRGSLGGGGFGCVSVDHGFVGGGFLASGGGGSNVGRLCSTSSITCSGITCSSITCSSTSSSITSCSSISSSSTGTADASRHHDPTRRKNRIPGAVTHAIAVVILVVRRRRGNRDRRRLDAVLVEFVPRLVGGLDSRHHRTVIRRGETIQAQIEIRAHGAADPGLLANVGMAVVALVDSPALFARQNQQGVVVEDLGSACIIIVVLVVVVLGVVVSIAAAGFGRFGVAAAFGRSILGVMCFVLGVLFGRSGSGTAASALALSPP